MPRSMGGRGAHRSMVERQGGAGGVFVNSWENAVLAALQAYNDQVYQAAFPLVDFMRGSFAAETVLAPSTSGSGANTYSSTGTGKLQLGKGASSGSAGFTTAANIIFPAGLPVALVARLQLTSEAAFTVATSADFLSFSNLTTYGIAIGFVFGQANFIITAADGGGSSTKDTGIPLPAAADEFDLGLLWTGSAFVPFFGQAVRGTFVAYPDGALTDLTHAGAMASARARSTFTDTSAVAKAVDVDKFQIFQGLTVPA